MESLCFHVDCIPPKTTAQQKRFAKVGNFMRAYDPKKVKDARSLLVGLLATHRTEQPFMGPVSLNVTWAYPWRKSEPKKNRVNGWKPCDTRPDCDNLLKAFCDALTSLSFWNDDSQIAEVRFQKRWSDRPGISVTIKSIGGLGK